VAGLDVGQNCAEAADQKPLTFAVSGGMILKMIRIKSAIRFMYVCICKAVTDKQVKAAVDEGAVSLRDLTRGELRVGTCCGRCVPTARECLSRYLQEKGAMANAAFVPEPMALPQAV